MVQRRVCAVTPCADTGPWEALAGMDNSEAAVQRNTPHKAAQDSGSEAGMTPWGCGAAVQRGTMAQTARLRRHPVRRHGAWEASAGMKHRRGNTTHKATQDSRSEAGMTGGDARMDCRTAAQLARKRMTRWRCRATLQKDTAARQRKQVCVFVFRIRLKTLPLQAINS